MSSSKSLSKTVPHIRKKSKREKCTPVVVVEPVDGPARARKSTTTKRKVKTKKFKKAANNDSADAFLEPSSIDESSTGEDGEDVLNTSTWSRSSDCVDEELVDEVMQEFDRISARYEHNVHQQTQGLFDACLQKRRDIMARQQANAARSPLVLEEPETMAVTAKLCCRAFDTCGTQDKPQCVRRVRQVILPDAEPLPGMTYWAPARCNYSECDSLELSHIPYMDEPVASNFGQELIDTYDEGIHGTLEGCGRRINNEMLHLLVSNMMRSSRYELPDGALPPEPLCKVVARQFPNKYSARKLRDEKWVDLVMRFGTKSECEAHQAHRVPNLDGPDAVFKSDPQQVMHSFSQLFCRSCYTYDCAVHGNNFRYSSQPKGAEREHVSRPTQPCGEHCFVHRQPPASPNAQQLSPNKRQSPRKSRGSQSPQKPTASPSQSSSCSLEQEQAKWAPGDLSLFMVLRSYFKDNYCWIAASLPPAAGKTCEQVAQLARLYGPAPSNNFETACGQQTSPKAMIKRKNRDLYAEFRRRRWTKTKGKVANQIPYVPCDHPGRCTVENNCNCAASNNECTKLCNCPGAEICDNFFPGCRCSRGQCRTKQCPCFKAMWECDPDVCKTCCDAEAEENRRCCNNDIQRGNAQELLLGVSDVAGWGCFVKRAVPRHGFISEYVGALITQPEAERRGKIYDAQKCSYLFNLNHDTSVDATKAGNKIRFANHSRHPNCCARLMRVKGDLRIGIYADKDIEPGEELFFDYSYNKHQQSSYVSIERMRLERIKANDEDSASNSAH